MIRAYFKLIAFPEAVRVSNANNSKARLDCSITLVTLKGGSK